VADQAGFAEFARFLPVAAGGRLFAVRIDRVIGVVESATITPLPFSPPPFEGLVLAMGQVVPQISLASLFGLASPEGGVVVLISDSGGSVGLRVDHVHSMLQIDLGQMGTSKNP
jgi:chemotaxis signal transduction protein